MGVVLSTSDSDYTRKWCSALYMHSVVQLCTAVYNHAPTYALFIYIADTYLQNNGAKSFKDGANLAKL